MHELEDEDDNHVQAEPPTRRLLSSEIYKTASLQRAASRLPGVWENVPLPCSRSTFCVALVGGDEKQGAGQDEGTKSFSLAAPGSRHEVGLPTLSRLSALLTPRVQFASFRQFCTVCQNRLICRQRLGPGLFASLVCRHTTTRVRIRGVHERPTSQRPHILVYIKASNVRGGAMETRMREAKSR